MNFLKGNYEQVIKSLQSRRSELNRAARQAMQQGMELFMGRVIREQYSGRIAGPQTYGPGGNLGGLNRRTGTLARGWRVATVMRGNSGLDVAVNMANSQAYARIHEYGGVIKPVKAKALAVPLSPAARGHSPREFDGLFMIKRPGRDPLLARTIQRKRSSRLEVMYVLKKEVKIPPRTHVREAFRTYGLQMVAKRVQNMIKKTLRTEGA